jgi:LCP family protein required for cell wall assembly
VGDRESPTWGGAGGRGAPDRARRSRSRADEPGARPLTVEQLLARQGSAVGHRRAAHRPEEPPPGAHAGRPPVRAAARGGQPGLPPVPPAARPAQPGLPPVPPPTYHPSLPVTPWPVVDRPAAAPPRHSTPIPPLPGLAPKPHAGRSRGRPPRSRPPRSRPDRPPLSPARRRLVRAVVALAAVVGFVALYHLGLYFYVDQKIDRVDALATDGPEVFAPALQAGAESYLIVGTGVPGETGPASVLALLASVSPEGDKAVLVSLPPTALVDTPVCRRDDGSLRGPASEAVATALLDGGPSCLVRAVQQLSGLRIDHYLGVDLARLPGMVDALGGVPVCVVPNPAAAAAATPLPAGRSEISGDAASGYLRPRDTSADGTGAAVAQRAQLLLTSTLRAALAPHTLANTVTLTTFLSRAADALTVDQQTTLGDLRVLASTLGDLEGDAVQRAALPVAEQGYVPAGSKEQVTLLDAAATRRLFDAIIDRTRVPDEILTAQAEAERVAAAPAAPPAPEASPAPAAPAEQPLTVAPGRITLDVLNGTATTGLAGTVADALRPGLHRRERRQRAGRGRPDRRPVRPERRRGGPHGRRRRVRCGAAAQRRHRRRDPPGHRSRPRRRRARRGPRAAGRTRADRGAGRHHGARTGGRAAAGHLLSRAVQPNRPEM